MSDQAISRRSKREKVLLIILAAVLGGGGAYKLTASGGNEPAVAVDSGTPHTAEDPAAAPSTAATAAGSVEDPSAGVLEHPVLRAYARDPFVPLIIDQSLDIPGATDGQPFPYTPQQARQPQTFDIKLVDIFPQKGELIATMRIQGTNVTVAEGQSIAKLLYVEHLGERCGVFRHDGEPFGLCVGQAASF